MWVDNRPASLFKGRTYVSWNHAVLGETESIKVTHSTDGGANWSNPVTVESAQFIRNVQITTGPDGHVFIAGMNENGGGLNPRQNVVYRSENGGQDWGTRIEMGPSFTPPGNYTCAENPYFATMFSSPSYWRYMGWGDIGAGPGGVIHYAYTQHGSGSDFGDIYYTRSTNDGLNWSTPTRIDGDPSTSTRGQWMPSLSVTPTGQVFISWYQQQNPLSTNYERWGRLSTDNGTSWSAADVLSDVASPLPGQPDPALPAPCYTGDYERSYADAGPPPVFHVPWVDGRVLIEGASQQDEFYDRVELPSP